MIAAVYPETRLRDVPADATALHLVRPVAKKKLQALLDKCNALERVTASESCIQRLPRESRKLLENTGLGIAAEAMAGRALSLPMEKMLQALEMRRDFQSLREIERVTGIPKSTVHYLEKYAQRGKIKNKGKVIYLK